MQQAGIEKKESFDSNLLKNKSANSFLGNTYQPISYLPKSAVKYFRSGYVLELDNNLLLCLSNLFWWIFLLSYLQGSLRVR